MVPDQESPLVALLQIEQEIDGALGIGAPIDVFADEDQLVPGLERQASDKALEFLEHPVNIAHRLDHSPALSARWEYHLRLLFNPLRRELWRQPCQLSAGSVDIVASTATHRDR